MVKKKKEPIKVSLKLLGRFYNAVGDTVQEAITALKPPIARGIGILTLKKGKLQRERILSPRVVNGVFGVGSPLKKNIATKSIVTLFNDFDQ